MGDSVGLRDGLVSPDHGRMLLRRLSLGSFVIGLTLALWPVAADATRYELELRSGAQPVSQLEARWADPDQRPFLARRPSCGPPVGAPLTYLRDSALRRGCAGPVSRSMSLAVLALVGGWLSGHATSRRTRPAAAAEVPAP